ncbi:MAG: glycosyltransferase family 39 protein [Oscillospiraceae bacterium]|nr:glycosyltransferase family 39 protein [Oscillospiraceae bacterium]
MTVVGIGISAILQLAFWGAAVMAFVRICKAAAGARDVQLERSESGARVTPIGKIILFALGVRLGMLALGYIILWMEHGTAPAWAELIYAFTRGDSRHYLSLAEIGYSWEENGRNILLVFFPLYGWLVRAVNLVVNRITVSAYLVSFASFAAALCYLHRLIRLDFSESVAWWALVLISIAPHAFFFGVPMTESLFLLTTLASLYYIRTHNWPLAGIAGALAIMTRMVGLVLIVVAAIEFAMHTKAFALIKAGKWAELFRATLKQGLWILLMLIGLAVYLLLNWYISGDPFRFMYYQYSHWYNQFAYFGSVLTAQVEHIVHQPHLAATIFIPNLLAFALTAGMLLWATVKRLPLAYIAFLLGYTFISYAVSWLLSGGRYMLAAAPLFIFLAHFTARRLIFRILVPLALVVGLVLTLRWYLLGGMVF